jgi:hypothetical protein
MISTFVADGTRVRALNPGMVAHNGCETGTVKRGEVKTSYNSCLYVPVVWDTGKLDVVPCLYLEKVGE